jgi:uncharacterized protein Usg
VKGLRLDLEELAVAPASGLENRQATPAFLELNKFLNFWLEKLEGPLHSVTVAHARLIKPAEIRAIDGEFRLH